MKNYDAWKINPDDFPKSKGIEDQLKFLINFAVLAPSSHNSQPWKFDISQSTIQVLPEFERALPASDTNHRQIFISLGCALENVLVAADYYNLDATTAYDDSRLIVTFQKRISNKPQEKSHLIFSIPTRHTNRFPYANRMPEQLFLDRIRSMASLDLRVYLVSDTHIKSEIADVILNASVAAMSEKGFRQELSRYVKSNITRSSLGMPGFTIGLPTPPSILAPFMVKHLNMAKLNRKKDEALLKKHTPVFAIVFTKNDDEENWLRAGQAYERIALEAEKRGINTAPLAAAIQIGEFYKDLQKILATPYRPQVFFRMGYADKKARHSPRLIPQEVMNP